MGGRSTRYEGVPIEAQAEVDAYKARSVWGRWWSLAAELRARLFTQAEIKWIRKHGARLDELACGARVPETDAQQHFVSVCNGDAAPTTREERLWLRVRVATHYAASLERARRCDIAEHRAAVAEAENEDLRRALREVESYAMELVREVRLLGGEPDAIRRQSLQNVEWSTPLFKSFEVVGPPRHYRVIRDDDMPRWVSQLIPSMRSAIAQGPRAELIDVFGYR
jgi:uncharacterized protein YifE (UPF0438 family)